MACHGFVKIDNIPGESSDESHDGWIEALYFDCGLTQPADVSSMSRSRAGGGGVQVEDFVFTKIMDKSSPVLALTCCKGTHIPKVEVELCESAGSHHPYMKYIMEKVIISGVQPGGSLNSGDGQKPAETIRLTFGKITWEYIPLDDDGNPGSTVRAGWDCVTNKPL
jgi:type VI secretion system secreted protein Hcp